MKIGIDVKWYFNGPPGGQRYIKNITDSLIAIDRKNHYYLFITKKSESDHFKNFAYANVTPVVIKTATMVPRVLFSLSRIIGTCGLDVILTQSYLPLSKRAIRCVTIYDTIYKDFPQFFTLRERLYFRFIDSAIKNSEYIFTISEHVKKRLIDIYAIEEKKILVTHLAAGENFLPLQDTSERERLRCKYHLPENFLLYVGRLNIRKNLHTLLSAVAKCKHDIPLVCVGKKDWKAGDKISKVIEDNKLEKRVRFTGFVNDEDLPGVYSLATAFVYIPFEEGFGIPPLEAMACGTPVIASNTSSIPEVVGDAGVLVDPRSEADVAQAIDSLLSSLSFQENLRRKGLERAQQFRWESSARKIVDFFDQINVKSSQH